MKVLSGLILFLLILYNVYLGSASVRNGEVNFFSDVARDFLLLQELDEKKIVLIGPRSSTNGLFHGPLWSYINYPSYVLGNGDPVAVAWFWIILSCTFLLTSFYIVKKLFGTFISLSFVLLISVKMAPHLNSVFHSEATFFFIPIFFFTIYMYIQRKKSIYLVFHLLVLAILIQLEVGIGIQFFILSALLIFWFIFKKKLWKHLFAFFLMPVFLSNLILFDLRHDLRMAKALVDTGKAFHFFTTFGSWIENRINNTISLQLFEGQPNNLFVFAIFFIVMALTVVHVRNKNKYREIYLLFAFYYFGYILMSFFNKGILLFHYIYLLMPLTTLWLVSFLRGKYKIFFMLIIGLVYVLNLKSSESYVNAHRNAVENDYNSWKGLSKVAQEVIAIQKGKEFGYYVFAPDALAYQPRYAMIYNFKKSNVKAYEYVKKDVTYIIAQPPPANDPYMTHVWWRKVPVQISSEPKIVKKFPNGYVIEKFELTSKEQRIPHDKSIELGIHFR